METIDRDLKELKRLEQELTREVLDIRERTAKLELLKVHKMSENGRVKKGEWYYYLYTKNEIDIIDSKREDNSMKDDFRYKTGNYFLTYEDAEKALAKMAKYRRCNRCHNSYDYTDFDKSMTIVIDTSSHWGRTADSLDMCPDCAKTFVEWMKLGENADA